MRGFTLIEGLVSMAIVTFVLFAAIGLYPSSVMATIQAGDQITATSMAQQILEDARLQDFASVAVGAQEQPSQTVQTHVYAISETVTQPAADVKQIVVTVSWTGRTGAESTTYQTAIFDTEGGME
jgi:Tfp pilus assembly protein PilV